MYANSVALPGEVVGVQVGVVEHVGVVSDRLHGGLPMVISNSLRRRGVAEEPWLTFADGGQVVRKGYPSQLPGSAVLRRARSLMGKKWSPFWNCEHFVRFAHNLPVESPQLRLIGLFGLLAIGAVAMAR